MAFKHERYKIPPSLDRRIKLTDKDREEIRLYLEGLSRRELADKYGVSKRLIQFILNPKSMEENKKRREERGGSNTYYDKSKHTEATKSHRKYKALLYVEGKLVKGEEN